MTRIREEMLGRIGTRTAEDEGGLSSELPIAGEGELEVMPGAGGP
jgi:hypothetical protein